jgi:ubiquinone/menaquinone biosynthesis C-methylase UbiE
VKEPFFEPLLRGMRLRRVLSTIRKHPECRLLDIGCGWEARLLRTVEPFVSEAVGIDFKAPRIEHPKLRTMTMTLAARLPFDDNSFDVVTLLAVLEHLSHPREMLEEISRVLRPGGQLVLTVPSPAAKPVLEFLAYRLRVISEAEIRDHKRYFDRKALYEILDGTGLEVDRHAYFQLGMNNFLCASKRDRQIRAAA